MAAALWGILGAGWSVAAESKSQAAPSRDTPNSLAPSTTKGPFYSLSENELRARKLARGVCNVILCPGEIPNQMFQEAYNTSPLSGSVVGAGKGVAKGAKRLVIGAWEILTFYHPGANYYQPYVEPEVVFQEYLH
jgi:putative exosortase-associated protein (TIGR04073 family)